MRKKCRYNCGRDVTWSDDKKFWIDADNGEVHSYKRCAEIQIEQGRKPVFDRVKA